MPKEFPTHIRRVSSEEYKGDKKLKNTEKMGYYNHDPVIVDMGPEYQKRLAELKKFSKDLNIAIKDKLDEADLPVTTDKKHNKILRINFQIRPPFVSTEDDKENNRFTPADDEVVIFWHINDDNTYNSLRTASRPWNQALLYSPGFDPNFNPDDKKNRLKSLIETRDITNLTNYITSELQKNDFIKYFQQVEEIKDISQAHKYFTNDKLNIFSDKIIQNLLKTGLLTLLKNQSTTINEQNLNKQQIDNLIADLLHEFMEIPIPNYEQEGKTAEEFLKSGLDDNKYKALINDIIKQAKDYYKTNKFQKK